MSCSVVGILGWHACVAINIFWLNLYSFISFIENTLNNFDICWNSWMGMKWRGENTMQNNTNLIAFKQFNKIIIHNNNNKNWFIVRFTSKVNHHILSFAHIYKLNALEIWSNHAYTHMRSQYEINWCEALDKINWKIALKICQTIELS